MGARWVISVAGREKNGCACRRRNSCRKEMPGRQDKQNISQCKMHNARQAEYLEMQEKAEYPNPQCRKSRISDCTVDK